MRKNFFSLVIAVVMIIGLVPQVSYAETSSEYVVFLNAENNAAIDSFDGAENVCAKVCFTAPSGGSACVITAQYDGTGALAKSPIMDVVNNITEGETVVLETTAVSAEGVSEIKIFAWNTLDGMMPALKQPGIITKTFDDSEAIDKFAALKGADKSAPLEVLQGKEMELGEFFSVNEGASVLSEFVSLSVSGEEGSASGEITKNSADWTKSTIKFTGEGIIKLTIRDYPKCKPCDVYVKVCVPTDKFEIAFENTEDYLYRIGNINAVSLSSLFKVAEGVSIDSSSVNISVSTVSGNANGEFTKNASDWKKGTIKFSGTGVAKVTITEEFANPASLLLEVVVAENATTLKSATSSDIVLLNDVSGSFTVSDGHNFYGNGFTVTLPTTTRSEAGAGFVGYVNLDSGNLDNVKINGPVYPKQYIYRHQAQTDAEDSNKIDYFYNSVIINSGDCTISNCFISGSRAALYIKGGNNVIVENTTISGGAYTNLEVAGAISVTLKDVTTIQKPETDSYGQGVTVLGTGVVVSTSIADVYIEGELNQYNWVKQAEAESNIPSEYRKTFKNFYTNSAYSQFWHYREGDTSTKYINFGMIFACDWDWNQLHNNRTGEVPYASKAVTLAGYSGGVYTTSGAGTLTDALYIAPEYSASGFSPVPPVFTFNNDANHDADDAEDEFDTYCVYSSGNLNIGVTGDSKTIDLSGVTVTKGGDPLDVEIYLNGEKVEGTSITLLASITKQTLMFKATDKDGGYTANGAVDGVSKEYTWRVNVDMATLAHPKPEWNLTITNGVHQIDAKTNCIYVVSGTVTDNDYGEAVPIFEGIKVNYYDKNGNRIEKDFSGTTTKPTGDGVTANAFTYTLSDGSVLTMKYKEDSGSWKKNSPAYNFNEYDGKVYIYPKDLSGGTYVRNNYNEGNFNVYFYYTFTDPNGNSTETIVVNWYNELSTNENITRVKWKTFDSTNGKDLDYCVTPDIIVMLADGSEKRIDEVTYDDELLVWNFYEGKYDTAPISLIVNHGYNENEIIELKFDDVSAINFVGCHGAFNKTRNEFVDINAQNVKEFIGDIFLKKSKDGFEEIKLIDYEVRKEYNGSYTILSSEHYNAVLNGILTVSPSFLAENLYEPFEVGESMKFDEEKMLSDIETYGLYTYEEFDDIISKEQFDMWNIKYVKVGVGKGYATYENIVKMILDIALPNV